MKFAFLFATLFFSYIVLNAQIDDLRYFDEVFEEVSIEEDIEYCTKPPVMILPGFSQANLYTDIYHPTNDTEALRPVVLVAHTGYFLPQFTEQMELVSGRLTGSKTDSATVETCKRLAQRGFVALAYTHRFGWNPLAATELERKNLFINAVYRDFWSEFDVPPIRKCRRKQPELISKQS